MKHGYATISSVSQDFSNQLKAIKVSGISLKNRDELSSLLDFAIDGDEIVVTN